MSSFEKVPTVCLGCEDAQGSGNQESRGLVPALSPALSVTLGKSCDLSVFTLSEFKFTSGTNITGSSLNPSFLREETKGPSDGLGPHQWPGQ